VTKRVSSTPWLHSRGWMTHREVGFVDVVAERDNITLYAEAKGRTGDTGLDVDTLYGQLLCRMPAEPVGHIRLGVFVPTEAVAAASRVSDWVRQVLRITIYSVDQDGAVAIAPHRRRHWGREPIDERHSTSAGRRPAG
jgi:hypothetical protein